MLHLTVPPIELFDEKKQEFIYTDSYELKLEHSLVSLSKWESKWRKPFLTSSDKTVQETMDYIRCMTIGQNVKSEAYRNIRKREMDIISDYIDAPMTATTISDSSKGRSKEVVTAEIIYYWMIAFNIPFECQTWHLNRLLTLISVCNAKNNPKKMSKKEALRNQKALNEARRSKFNTSG